jgi:flagellar hook-associated protein 1 FlgK
VYNTTGATGYGDRLNELVSQMSATRTFDPAAAASTSASIGGMASSSAAWLEAARKSASESADYQDTLLQRSSDALSKATGVNIDEEMMLLLEIERSYQASTKLITAVDDMFRSLLAATGAAA